MDGRILVGLGAGRMHRLNIALTLLVSAGRAFEANAQTEAILHLFVGYPTDGASPVDALVQGNDGSFYGTTSYGGTITNLFLGWGTVFRISPSGSYSNLYSFTGGNDGVNPNGLVQASDGNFYGTTYSGGTSGQGTVFRISPDGSYSNLYSFTGNDGAGPSGLVQGSDGNFYGTTDYAGAYQGGTVFRISPSGSYSNLHSFTGGNDGAGPNELVQGSDGNFYGTTDYAGAYKGGTVFRISPSGSLTTLYSFTYGIYGPVEADGSFPAAGLVPASDGKFYGTTYEGGKNSHGTVFRISPSGSYSNLYSFSGVPNDGARPLGLVLGSDGSFYGTTDEGGASTNCGYGCGTVFRISLSGSYSNLYSFNYNNGAQPNGLVQGSDGNFYGTTGRGGTNYSGVVFKLSVPLNPPANQISAVQIAGTDVAFSIPSVAGETYQLQFSSSMTPTNWSNVPGASVTNSIGALLTVTNFGGAVGPQGFYRFDITP